MGETNVPRFPGRSSRSRRVEGLQEDRSEGANVRDNATRVVSPRLTVQMQSAGSASVLSVWVTRLVWRCHVRSRLQTCLLAIPRHGDCGSYGQGTGEHLSHPFFSSTGLVAT